MYRGPLSEGKGQPSGILLRLVAEWIVLANVASHLLPALVAEVICKVDNNSVWKMVRALPSSDLIVTDEFQTFGQVLLSQKGKADCDLARLCIEALPAKFKKKTLSSVRGGLLKRRV
jgi:hypothetical protein